MRMAEDGVYGLNRKHVWMSVAAVVSVAAFALLLTVVVPGLWKWASLGFAGLALWSLAPSARLLGDARPVLVVSAEGLLYRPFAPHAAPWSEITAVAFVRGYSRFVAWGRVSWKRQTASDQINFDVADLSRYPNSVGRRITRALQRLGKAPPISVQLWLLDADGEAICAEIAKHWPGKISVIEQRLDDASRGGQTS